MVAGLVTLGLLSSGCSFLMKDKIHYVVRPASESTDRCPPRERAEPADRMVGVALSGGGSRAAVFGAAALEALSEHGLLGQVSHISSVSGGSLVASYYLTHPPACDQTATRDAQQTCWHEYFAEFKRHMRFNFESGTLLRNSRPWRATSPTRRATSLQEGLDKRFLHGRTFGDLGPRPVLLINASSYDEARRFVFSNVCLAEGVAEASEDSTAHSAKRYRSMAEKALARRALQARTFSRPGCVRPVPGDLPVSLAVVTSAAFPPVIGPVAFEAPSACEGGETEWWHLGDGGVIENSGADSLEEILLRRLAGDDPPPRKTLILSVDAGAYADPQKLERVRNFKLNSSADRLPLIVDAPRGRGQAYHGLFWDEFLDELAKEGIDYEKITFQHSRAELDELPASCAGKISGDQTLRDHLVEIPTRFKVNQCNADLLELAAHQLVHEALDDETVRRLRSQGLSIHAGAECAVAR